MTSWLRILSVLALVASVVGLFPRHARACGAFASARGPSDATLYARTPYLAVEQTLILWDKDTLTEDFIREARFAKTGQSFGFVVPTPGRPEVSKVDESPFPALRKSYPFGPSMFGHRSAGGIRGARGGGGGAQVEVLSQQRIGSFDVTVLTASDAGALDGWLAKNGFAMTTEAQPWLAHYVELRFFFVAFRYAEPPPGTADGMTSETVRIRFESAAPFYPYLEPDHPAGVFPPSERMLSAWLVTQEEMTPVVNRASASGPSWKTPWDASAVTTIDPARLVTTVPALKGVLDIRSKSLRVQPFRDLRTSRAHLGDALFAYRTPQKLSREHVAALRPLLPVLDPSIAPAAPAPLENVKRARCAASNTLGAASDTYALPVLLALGGIAALRRARRRAVSRLASGGVAALLVVASVCLVACHKNKPVEVVAPNESAVIALLSGNGATALPWAPPTHLVSTVTIGDVRVEPPVDDVRFRLADLQPALGRCFDGAAPLQLDVDLAIDAAGHVTRAHVTNDAPELSGARFCAENEVKRMTLLSAGTATKGSFRMTIAQEMRE
jgi:hypothetical protein